MDIDLFLSQIKALPIGDLQRIERAVNEAISGYNDSVMGKFKQVLEPMGWKIETSDSHGKTMYCRATNGPYIVHTQVQSGQQKLNLSLCHNLSGEMYQTPKFDDLKRFMDDIPALHARTKAKLESLGYKVADFNTHPLVFYAVAEKYFLQVERKHNGWDIAMTMGAPPKNYQRSHEHSRLITWWTSPGTDLELFPRTVTPITLATILPHFDITDRHPIPDVGMVSVSVANPKSKPWLIVKLGRGERDVLVVLTDLQTTHIAERRYTYSTQGPNSYADMAKVCLCPVTIPDDLMARIKKAGRKYANKLLR